MSVRLGENADFESSMNGTGTVHAYGYDLAGRRTAVGGSYARTNVPPAAPTASYNLNNQLTNWNGATLTYDANGNLTNDGTNTYMWNARNQLVTISGSVNANFQYDAFGRRVSKTINGTTQFLFDGVNPVQEISGSSAAANLLTGGIDEVFQRTDLAGARSFMTDALGSTVALADSTGTVQSSYTFEPFGNTTVTGAATTNSFAYTGRELDSTGLYFYRARYYNPQLQRFISEDPLGFSGGDANLYGYVGNGPANFRDASGMNRGCFTTACGGVPDSSPLKGRKPPRRRGLPPGWYRCDVNGVRVAGGEFGCDGRGHIYPAPLGNLSDPIFNAFEIGALTLGVGAASGLFEGAAESGAEGLVEDAVDVTFGHGARHLAGTGLAQDAVESAISADIQNIVANSTATGNFWGQVVVDGQTIVYRAFTLADGTINIGTYTVGVP